MTPQNELYIELFSSRSSLNTFAHSKKRQSRLRKRKFVYTFYFCIIVFATDTQWHGFCPKHGSVPFRIFISLLVSLIFCLLVGWFIVKRVLWADLHKFCLSNLMWVLIIMWASFFALFLRSITKSHSFSFINAIATATAAISHFLFICLFFFPFLLKWNLLFRNIFYGSRSVWTVDAFRKKSIIKKFPSACWKMLNKCENECVNDRA